MTLIYEVHQKVDYELSFEQTFVRIEQLPVFVYKTGSSGFIGMRIP